MATKAEEEAAKEIRADIKAQAAVKELKKENKALAKLNRGLKSTVKKADEQPNVLQVAATGTAAIVGVGSGIALHRLARDKTQLWVDEKDPTKRKMSAVIVSEVLPITAGLAIGTISAFSDSGLVCALGGGGGFGLAAGFVVDLFLPGPPPKPPEPKP